MDIVTITMDIVHLISMLKKTSMWLAPLLHSTMWTVISNLGLVMILHLPPSM